MAKSRNTQETQENQNEVPSTLESSQESIPNPSETPSEQGEQDKGESSQESSTPNNQNSIQDFNDRLNAALDSSVEWREQMRLCLQAIQEVYIAFVALDESYQTGLNATNDALEKLATSTAKVDDLASQIAKSIAQARKDFERMQETANQTLADAQNAAQVTTTNATTTNENLKATEAIWDKTREMGQEIIRKESIIIEAFEKFKVLQSMLDNANTLKAELDSKLEAHRSQLNADKEGYETELNQKKDEITRTLEAFATGKQEALNALSETKNQALEAKINELNTQLETHKQEIETARATLATDHDSLKNEILEALKQHLAEQNTEQAPQQ